MGVKVHLVLQLLVEAKGWNSEYVGVNERMKWDIPITLCIFIFISLPTDE